MAVHWTKFHEEMEGTIRDCVRRGVHPPPMPDVPSLWVLLDSDGPAALLVTLDYLSLRRELVAGAYQNAA